jgi:uncharacterized Zn ribbon protein
MDEHDCQCCGGRFVWNEKLETHVCDHCGTDWNSDEHVRAATEIIDDSPGDGKDKHAF